MKYTISIITAIIVSSSVLYAQDGARPEKEKSGGRGGDMRQRMHDRMKSQRDGEGGSDRGEMFERMLRNPEIREKLGLSEKDAEKITEEILELKTKAIDLKAEMDKIALEQAKLISSKEVDGDKLISLARKAGDLRTEIGIINIKRMMLVREHIPAEKMEAVRGEIQERMRNHEGGGQRPEGKMEERRGSEGDQRDAKHKEEMRRRRPAAEDKE